MEREFPQAIPSRPALGELTAREGEILQAIADGRSNSEIAAVLHLSLETVKTHVKAILRKLQARNRTQAVVQALQAGLVQLARERPGDQTGRIGPVGESGRS
ncbi:MAG: response regulator transcription factor [Cyanobacteriota bacterium]|nr:response regulator transcription factor [Cyanobacteriota bacterium]